MKNIFPTMNLNTAQAAYPVNSRDGREYIGQFSFYSPAYVISNENLRWITGLTKNIGQRVLTTTGSGDQPMFYSLNGATHVDTFDISFCAKVIMDIKMAALKTLPREEYIALLDALRKTGDAQSIQKMQDIMHQIPENSANFIRNMRGYKIFTSGWGPNMYKEHLPTDAEYTQMREIVKHPFKFIWTDLSALHTHLIGEYDIINLSNIFEHTDASRISPILASLRNYVRPGGYIIAQSGGMGIHNKRHAYITASEKFKRWARIGMIKENPKMANSEEIVILQRTR